MSDDPNVLFVPDTDPEDVPDHANPALIDAEKTFAVTLVTAIVFMGAVAVLIL